MIETVTKNIAAMPYSEMMILAKYLAQNLLASKNSPEFIAEVLSRARADLGDQKLYAQENKILMKAFARKRQVNVKSLSSGYAIEVPSLPGSTVTGTDLRAMFGQMLDQVVTMEVLRGLDK
jgi:hypothetical protein